MKVTLFQKKWEKEMVLSQTKKDPKMPVLKIYQHSEQGNREYQQDAVYISTKNPMPIAANKKTRVLGIVCDGMGGMEDGSKASQTAIAIFQEGFEQVKKEPNLNIQNFLLQGVKKADSVIHNFPSKTGGGSGTTIVAVMTENDQLYWVSVGDSRIYFLRNGNLERLTRDHNYGMQLDDWEKAGKISPEEAKRHPKREALISFLGIGNVGNPSPVGYGQQQLMDGDLVLLCSDGITKVYSDAQLREILLSSSSSSQEKAAILVKGAIRYNPRSQDNTSVIIVEYVVESVKENKNYRGNNH